MSLMLNEDEMTALLQEVDRDLNNALAKSEDLAKGDDEKSASASASPEMSASPEGSASASPEGSASASASDGAPPFGEGSASASDAGSMPHDDAAMPPHDEAAEGQAPGAEMGGEDLESKLMALPFEQLHHLYLAAKQAVYAHMQASAGPSAAAGAPPAAPPAEAGPAASPSASASPAMAPPPALKAEMKASPANGGGKTSAVKLGKSEGQDDMDQKKLEDLQAQVAGLTKALTMVVGLPLRKAVTGLSHVAKPDGSAPADAKKDVSTLSKAEITAKLTEKTRDPSLAKKDREAINGYYDGRFNLDRIAHLLQ